MLTNFQGTDPTPSYFLSQSHAACKDPTWAGLPLKSQREKAPVDRAALCTKLGTQHSPGGKACFPNRMLAMLRIWFQKQSFQKDCGTAKMEPTQLLEKDLTEELRQKAKF